MSAATPGFVHRLVPMAFAWGCLCLAGFAHAASTADPAEPRLAPAAVRTAVAEAVAPAVPAKVADLQLNESAQTGSEPGAAREAVIPGIHTEFSSGLSVVTSPYVTNPYVTNPETAERSERPDAWQAFEQAEAQAVGEKESFFSGGFRDKKLALLEYDAALRMGTNDMTFKFRAPGDRRSIVTFELEF